MNFNTLFSDIVFVFDPYDALYLSTSDSESAWLRHICGMKVMAMLLSKFILLSRYYANILNSEVIQANYIILNINTLFSEIYFVIWLHKTWNLVTSDSCSTMHGHYCCLTNMVRLLSKFRLLSRYCSIMLNTEVRRAKHVILKLNTLFSDIGFVISLHKAFPWQRHWYWSTKLVIFVECKIWRRLYKNPNYPPHII